MNVNETGSPKNSASSSLIRVLYVDDDVDFALMTQNYLNDLFNGTIAVTTINNPTVTFVELQKGIHDIIVSDFSMVQIDGLTLLQQARQAGFYLPFVIFTGKSREEVAIQALNLGADYYIKKGGDPESQYRELGHVIQKVVQHNRTEEKLQKSETQLQQLMSQNLLGMIIIQDGFIRFANQAITSMLGYTKEEMLSWSPEEFANAIHPDDRQFVLEQARKFQSGDKDARSRYSFKVFTKNNKTKFLDKFSETIMYEGKKADLASIIDITDRVIRNKAFEEMLLESEERYRSLVESMNEGLIIQNADNVITYVNDAMSRMFLYPKQEMMGSSTENFLDEESRELFRSQTRRNSSSASKKYELTGLRKDGSEIRILVSPRAILGKQGKFKGSFAIVTDITSLKTVENSLRENQEDFKYFADFVSHDAKNSLMTLLGYIQLMESKEELTYLGKIEKQAKYLQQQFESSMKLIRAGRAIENKEMVNLNRIVDQLAEMTVPKGIVFQRDDLPVIACDPDKIPQVFKNLLENAVIHGKPGNIQVRYREEGDLKLITVLDDGNNLNPVIKSELFTKKLQAATKNGRLGMVIVRKIIKAHGWDIRLLPDSDLTIFEISIPNK